VDVNAAIIDQRVGALADEIRERASDELGVENDEPKLRSLAFVFLCVRTLLDLDFDEAFDCLVEGGQDFGVDAVHLTDERDGEFSVTLFQGKYKAKLDGSSGFPGTGIEKLAQAVRHLFDPSSELQTVNRRLRTRLEQIRSMIRDGFIPRVRAIACNNGKIWESNGAEAIRLAGFGDQVTWEHVNHQHLVKLLQASKPISDRLQLTGRALVEDMNFSRVLVGRISVEEVAALVGRHGQRLLERNIRRYLGLRGNRVNEEIQRTLLGPERNNFYFFNNGITLTCDKFAYNALQGGDFQVQVENLQIINGGQTCMTLFETLRDRTVDLALAPASVLLRLYQLPSDNEDLVRRITYATNSQNPVDLRDLRANDERQQRLELDIAQLGFSYRRKRADQAPQPADIGAAAAAEAVLAIWRQQPHRAKFFSREHFGKLYEFIFRDDLSGTQVVIAVLLYRIAENRRRRPQPNDPTHVRYASAFIAMQMGRRLLAALGAPRDVDHRVFERARAEIDANGEALFEAAAGDIDVALRRLYGERELSLQQLAATFRRGDLIDELLALEP
jgi:hypothetical protein